LSSFSTDKAKYENLKKLVAKHGSNLNSFIAYYNKQEEDKKSEIKPDPQ
jgi:hypothetical protein